MKNIIKLTLLLIFCLSILQIKSLAQSNAVDDEISSLEKRLIELKQQKISEYEAEIRKMKSELEKLKGGPSDTPNIPPVQPSGNSPQTNVSPTLNPQLKADNSPVPINLPSQQVQGKCTQIAPTDMVTAKICAIAKAAIEDGNGKVDIANSGSELAYVIATKINTTAKNESLLADSEKKRTDKQVGASSTSAGTTSLAVKGGAPTIIGWALENGSATSSINGNTVTIRVNPYNLGNALFRKQSLFDIKNYAEGSKKTNDLFEEGLKKLSFGFSFDTSRGQETPTFIVSKRQLSAWSVRYEFINHRNPLSKFNEAKRNTYFSSIQAPILDAFENSVNNLFTDPNFQLSFDKWLLTVNTNLLPSLTALNCNPAPSEVNNPIAYQACKDKAYGILETQFADFPVADITKNDTAMANLRSVMKANENFTTSKEKFLEEVNKGAVAAFEYTNNREVNAPDTSNFRFIWEKGVVGKVDFTLNAELTMFNKKPAMATVKRIKDFDVALQFDAPLNDTLLGNSVLSGSLKYTRQQGDVVLPNGFVANGTKGDILFGQAKLTIPFGDTGIKFPFSLTFGNRSEFIKEKFARANFGFTFDLDQIFRPLSIFK